MHKEFSPKKKQQLTELARWVRAMIPELPHNTPAEEYMEKMTPTQRRRVQKRVAKIMMMK